MCGYGDFVIVCTRESEGAIREGEGALGTYWVHLIDDVPRDRRPPVQAPRPTVERATVGVRHRAYATWLNMLALSDEDRAGLRRRGLTDAQIDDLGYRTMPVEGRAAIARSIVGMVGAEEARGIPGLVWRHRRGEDPNRGWWHVRGAPGLLIPVRDIDGRIAALKVRQPRPKNPKNKYLYVTSSVRPSDEGTYVDIAGAPAASVAHVPIASRSTRASATRLIVTEGEIKADIITALSGAATVSVPGVDAWALGVDAATAWGPELERVHVAFDMDLRTNARVAETAECLLYELRREGFATKLLEWDIAEGKGLDDVLAHRRGVQRAA